MIEAVGHRVPPPASSFPYKQHLIFPRVDAAAQHRRVGLVFVDRPKLAAQQPHRRVEPLQTARKIGEQQVGGVVQAQVRLFVAEDRLAVARKILLRDHDPAAPAERRDSLRHDHERPPCAEPPAAPPADDAHDARQRPDDPEQHARGPEGVAPSCRLFPREGGGRRGCSRRGGRFDNSRRKRLRRQRHLAVERDDAERQDERRGHRPQHHDAVQAVEGLAAQQQFEKEVEDRQAHSGLQAVDHQGVHGQRRFSCSMRSISSRSSPTEIFSSSMSAETAPR